MTRYSLLLCAIAILAGATENVEAQLFRRGRNRNNCQQCCTNCNQSVNQNQTAQPVAVAPETAAYPSGNEAVSNEPVSYPSVAPVISSEPMVYATPTPTTSQFANPVAVAGVESFPSIAPNPVGHFMSYFGPQVVSGHSAVQGFKPDDVGYDGPGDMRTHLWTDHKNDLLQRGIAYQQLMSLPMNQVQQLHNQFHAAEIQAEMQGNASYGGVFF